jgi:AcrR family transcriptional regulator
MGTTGAANLSGEATSRDKILDAAEGLFSRRGYSGVGLREVADLVGLGKSSLFHHFRSKPELYSAVCARILRNIEERLVRSLALGGTPAERFERWLSELIDLLAQNPSYARVLLRSLFEDDDLTGDSAEERAAHRAIESIMGSVGRLLREGMSSGEMRVASVPHLMLLLVGQAVFPFASGEFGCEVLGKEVFEDAEVTRLKAEVLALARFGLIRQGGDSGAARRKDR